MRAERGFRCAGWVGKTGAKVTVRSRTFFFWFFHVMDGEGLTSERVWPAKVW